MRLHQGARAPKKATKVKGLREPYKAGAAAPVPVTEGLVACPTCGGGVKLVGASFSDPESGITVAKTKLYASHVFGGARACGHTNRCPSSHMKAEL